MILWYNQLIDKLEFMDEIMNKKVLSIFLVVLAAALYAINIPLSKLLLNCIEPTMMASYLYLGAGIGIGLVFLITKKTYYRIPNEEFVGISREEFLSFMKVNSK